MTTPSIAADTLYIGEKVAGISDLGMSVLLVCVLGMKGVDQLLKLLPVGGCINTPIAKANIETNNRLHMFFKIWPLLDYP
jgi:hypothetical protein